MSNCFISGLPYLCRYGPIGKAHGAICHVFIPDSIIKFYIDRLMGEIRRMGRF
jgi:hypothetical protein